MLDDTPETDQRVGRRRYMKPFVRNLDMADTEGKTQIDVEFLTRTTFHFGPS